MQFTKWKNQWKNFALNTLLPQHCLYCQKQGQPICPDCLSLISLNEFLYCPFCSKPKRILEEQIAKGKALCPKHYSSQLNGLLSAASYQQALVKKLITNFKYPPYLKNLSSALSFLIIAHLKLSRKEWLLQTGENSIVLAVPQEKSKQKKRGFNPAFLLAQEIARFYQLPLTRRALIKIKKTSAQARLNRRERLANLRDCFQVGQPEIIVGKKIFLVDDVLTTGSTLEECARILKQSGAKQVWGLTIARDTLEN